VLFADSFGVIFQSSSAAVLVRVNTIDIVIDIVKGASYERRWSRRSWRNSYLKERHEDIDTSRAGTVTRRLNGPKYN